MFQLSFIPLVPYPPLRGTFPSRGRLLMRGEAVFSFCNLCHSRLRDSRFPHMCLALLRFPHLSFRPLEPYPARCARHLPHAGKAGDTRETCHPQTFGHRPIYICGEAATTTLNPEPFFLLQNIDELAIILITQGKRKSFSDVFQRQGGW